MAEAGRERRLRELFDQALALPAGQRESMVAAVDDELLAERLRALLLQDALGTTPALQRAPLAGGLQQLRRIGRYELLRELGHGGMGTVLLARQVEPVERLVALKMVHPGTDSQEVAQRFALERQALALMDHPGIARIFDGGATDDGVPYFVMEYVRGEPITGYCDRRQLDCAARIALFERVCDAVQHAHQKAILHRDLKPGNLLVCEAGGRPQPKVIDFGVARALGGGHGMPAATQGGGVVGTYAYMSPEQADPGGQDVDTRTDVYALGAVLYELLTGKLPLEPDPAAGGIAGFQRRLMETPPLQPSARVAALPPEAVLAGARARGTTPGGWLRQLRGDLDWIVLRALEKDRNRRYASVADLAADLVRHRRAEPVEAGPPSLRYRLGKFVRRHRAMVAGGTLLLLGLVAGLAGTTWGMVAAHAARDVEAAARQRQARQLDRERAVADYFEFLLFYGDPGTGHGVPSLRDVLDRLAPTIATRLGDQPIAEAAVRAAVGRAYLAMGEAAKAEAQLALAWQLAAAQADADPGVAGLVLYDLARARRLAGGPGAGRGELVAMFDLGIRALAEQAPDLVPALQRLVEPLRGGGSPWAEVLVACDAALEALAGKPWDAAATRLAARLVSAVGQLLQDAGVAGSEPLLDRLEVVARGGLGGDVDFLLLLGRFAERQLDAGRWASARRLAAEVLASLDARGVRDHWLVLQCERVRGLALALADEPAAGEAALLALQRRLEGLPADANASAHAAAAALAELCVRLDGLGRRDAFLAASLQRWLEAVATDRAPLPWWPAALEGLPLDAVAAARTIVERELASGGGRLLPALRGALLLREDRAEAAAAAFEAAFAGASEVAPEVLAEAAIARHRVGRGAAAAELVAVLRQQAAAEDPLAMRAKKALVRAQAAGL
ncbi:MAG: serine/threonine protein kinase [Planctomycetes bacterium]|nr:serine/threonine protein kinase [Planctomycetota bacterium]